MNCSLDSLVFLNASLFSNYSSLQLNFLTNRKLQNCGNYYTLHTIQFIIFQENAIERWGRLESEIVTYRYCLLKFASYLDLSGGWTGLKIQNPFRDISHGFQGTPLSFAEALQQETDLKREVRRRVKVHC